MKLSNEKIKQLDETYNKTGISIVHRQNMAILSDLLDTNDTETLKSSLDEDSIATLDRTNREFRITETNVANITDMLEFVLRDIEENVEIEQETQSQEQKDVQQVQGGVLTINDVIASGILDDSEILTVGQIAEVTIQNTVTTSNSNISTEPTIEDKSKLLDISTLKMDDTFETVGLCVASEVKSCNSRDNTKSEYLSLTMLDINGKTIQARLFGITSVNSKQINFKGRTILLIGTVKNFYGLYLYLEPKSKISDIPIELFPKHIEAELPIYSSNQPNTNDSDASKLEDDISILVGLIDRIQDTNLKNAMTSLFIDNNHEYAVMYASKPMDLNGNKGDLLRHSVNLALICDYKFNLKRLSTSWDCLIAGALLCNLGKVFAISLDNDKNFAPSQQGAFYGDSFIGAHVVLNKFNEYTVGKEFKIDIIHTILSNGCMEPLRFNAKLIHAENETEVLIENTINHDNY